MAVGTDAAAPFEIVAGPADVYIAPVGTGFPAVNAAAAGWTLLGKTEGGTTVRHTQNIEILTTDQNTGGIKGIRTEEGLEVEFALAETTLERYAIALNNATVTTDAGPPAIKRIPLYRGRKVAQHALLVRRDSPYGAFVAQYQAPVVIQTEEPETEYTKDDKTVLACMFVALEDPNASGEIERFGRLVAQTA